MSTKMELGREGGSKSGGVAARATLRWAPDRRWEGEVATSLEWERGKKEARDSFRRSRGYH